MILRRSALAGIAAGLVGAVTAAFSGSAIARDFTITAWGGTFQENQDELWWAPFAKEKGIDYLTDVYLGGWAQFAAMQDTGQVPWDVVQVESAELARGCEEGMFVALDWSRIAGKDMLIEDAVSDCGVGVVLWALAPAHNAGRVDIAPDDLGDFWDVQTWPGKRGMRAGPNANLEMALMAEGVAPDEVYDLLSTDEGVDRAFAKLDEIKDQLQFWEAGAQPAEWLAAGDVAMSIAYPGRVMRARDQGAPLEVVWDHAVYNIDSYAILAGSPHRDLAYDFLKSFVANTHGQVEHARFSKDGPVTKAGIAVLPAEVKADLPTGDNIANGLFAGSAEGLEFWLDHQEELTARWNAWLQR